VTCSTFALYTTSFTKDANKALIAAETPEGDGGAKKRSDFLVRFETNFNHWLNVRQPFLPPPVRTLKSLSFRSTSTAYNFMRLVRTCLYFLSLFALIVSDRRHSGSSVMQRGINLRSSQAIFRLPYLPASDTLLPPVSLCCCEIL
jgi:hypothetical protein